MSIVALVLDVVCTFNEIFWLYQWVNVFLEKKDIYKNKYGHRIEGILYAVYMITVLSLNQIKLTSAYTMIVITIVNLVAVFALWESDIIQSIAIVGGYYFFLFLKGNIEISITGMVGGEVLIQNTTSERGVVRIIYLILSGGLLLVLNKQLLGCYKKRNLKIQGIKGTTYVSVIGFIGCAFLGTMMLQNFNIHINTGWYLFMLILLIMIFVLYFLMKQKDTKMGMMILAAKNEMLERNYMQVNEFYTSNAKLYHDMNHHLDALYHLLQQGNQEQAKEYISSLRNSDICTEIKIQSGINILDAIFHEMSKKAEKKGVRFIVDTPLLPIDLGITNGDMCSLFANVLDNAVEAAMKVVSIEIKKINHTLHIVVQNDYVVLPIKKNGLFLSQKNKKGLHGWGTQIVEQIVKKYDGDIEYKIEEEYFTVYFTINEN